MWTDREMVCEPEYREVRCRRVRSSAQATEPGNDDRCRGWTSGPGRAPRWRVRCATAVRRLASPPASLASGSGPGGYESVSGRHSHAHRWARAIPAGVNNDTA